MNASVIGGGGACRSVAGANADLKHCSMSPVGIKVKTSLTEAWVRLIKGVRKGVRKNLAGLENLPDTLSPSPYLPLPDTLSPSESAGNPQAHG
jgi:hypothetical protein